MKIFRLLLITVCMAISLSTYAKKHIKFNGKWNKREKSIIPQEPVEAWLEDNGKDISLQFYSNLGPVKVTVTNSSGKIVYEETVDAITMSSWNIVLEAAFKGKYMLSITNEDNVLKGDFFIY